MRNNKNNPNNRRVLKNKNSSIEPPILVLFNKPFNTLCQFTGELNDSTLADFIPIKGVYAAGRLDKDSEGLLLLTNDGQLQNKISHPKHKMAKTYWVQVEGDISKDALLMLSKGVRLKDGMTKSAKALLLESTIVEETLWRRDPPVRFRKNIPTSWIELSIKEGKNRQVRRMTAAVGFPTLRLIRRSVGEWSIKSLIPGEYLVLNNPSTILN